jgi:hypothetical protein
MTYIEILFFNNAPHLADDLMSGHFFSAHNGSQFRGKVVGPGVSTAATTTLSSLSTNNEQLLFQIYSRSTELKSILQLALYFTTRNQRFQIFSESSKS